MSTQTATLTQRAAAKAVAPVAPQQTTAVAKVTRGGQVVRRVPSARPPFTVGDIRRAIPAHCFSRPLTKSFAYLFADLAGIALLFYASTFIDTLLPNERFGATWGPVLRHVLWTAYWIAQGIVGTGLWVIGHECGHRGFADSAFINDAVGLVFHSALLVPYFAWQMSHKRHHSNTGSVEHDEVFVPSLASKEQQEAQAKKDQGHMHEDEGAISNLLGVVHRLFFMVRVHFSPSHASPRKKKAMRIPLRYLFSPWTFFPLPYFLHYFPF
jgi:fatty acid desaturase